MDIKLKEIFKMFKELTGVSQKELSERSGIARGTINAAVNDRKNGEYEPSRMLKKEVLNHMYKIVDEKEQEVLDTYETLKMKIDVLGVSEDAKSKKAIQF